VAANHEREVIMKKIKSILLPKKPLYLITVLICILSYCSRFLPSRVASNFLIFLTMMTGLPFYLDKAESKKTKIGWFVFTIIAVIFELIIVYIL
jgi:hypothetical protein